MSDVMAYFTAQTSQLEYPPNVTVGTPTMPSASASCFLEVDFPWLISSPSVSLANLEDCLDTSSLIPSPTTGPSSFMGFLEDPVDMFTFKLENEQQNDDIRTVENTTVPENVENTSSPQADFMSKQSEFTNFPAFATIEDRKPNITLPTTMTHWAPTSQTDARSDISSTDGSTGVRSPDGSRRSSSSSGFCSLSPSDSVYTDVEKSPAPLESFADASSDSLQQSLDVSIIGSLTGMSSGRSTPESTPSPQSPDTPSSTQSVTDTKKVDPNKPTASYVELIARALLTSSDYRMILSDIYGFVLRNYPYYETARGTWRNAVRHNLCVNDCFIKAGRSNSGRGFYWAIHPACVDMFKKSDFRRHQARKLAQQMIPPPNSSRNPSPSSWANAALNCNNVQIGSSPYMGTTAVATNPATAQTNIYFSRDMFSSATVGYGSHVTTPSIPHHQSNLLQFDVGYLPSYSSQDQRQQQPAYYNQYYPSAVTSRYLPNQPTMY